MCLLNMQVLYISICQQSLYQFLYLYPLSLFKVIYCPKEVQLICLSATVANPDELAGWIGQVLQ